MSRELVDEKGYEYLGAIKIDDDLYIVPTNIVRTLEIDRSFLKGEISKNSKLIRDIEALEFPDEGCISVNCKDKFEDGTKVIEINNIEKFENEEVDCAEILLKSELTWDDREELLTIMANLNKDKDLCFTFYIPYNYETLRKAIEDIENEKCR